MLNWANQFNICCFLDNHQYTSPHHSYECVLGVGALRYVQANAGNAFTLLKAFQQQNEDWLFGHFGYDLKNETENLTSAHARHSGFPDLFFFVPETVLLLSEQQLSIGTINIPATRIWQQLLAALAPSHKKQGPVPFNSRFSRDAYIDTVTTLQQHILRGDCYEINFCQEFYADNTIINPLQTYQSLSAVSPNPFAAYYKWHNDYLLCASPERYLRKTGNQLIAQPIKGTWQRNHTSIQQDEINKALLYNSGKDRSENVMIVDLMRNDLAKVCEEGSVQVAELFGMYSFPQVHQMISTITGTMKAEIDWVDVIKATFPMGSMTGAPKTKVLQLIEQYERSRRGLFSGAVGYVTPQRAFDFNVVIRSILYNQATRYVSYQVGSGITFYSDAIQEYEECLLKAAAIKKVLE